MELMKNLASEHGKLDGEEESQGTEAKIIEEIARLRLQEEQHLQKRSGIKWLKRDYKNSIFFPQTSVTEEQGMG